jgi:hypothetical protein
MTNQEKFDHFGKIMLMAEKGLTHLTEEDLNDPRVILREETEQLAFLVLAVGKNFLKDEPLHAAFNMTGHEKLKNFGLMMSSLELGLASKWLL